jgi:hypothetical protein
MICGIRSGIGSEPLAPKALARFVERSPLGRQTFELRFVESCDFGKETTTLENGAPERIGISDPCLRSTPILIVSN